VLTLKVRSLSWMACATRSVAALLALAAVCVAPVASAQFPSRPVTLIVPYSPGGSADALARVLAQHLGAKLGVSVIVENRPGASGTIGEAAAAKAAPDGHTLLYTGTAYTINPHLFATMPYADGALQALALVSLMPNVLIVPAASPWQSVQDLVAQARAQPGTINFASGGSGTLQRMAAELFQQKLQLDMVHVPYKSGGPAIAGVMGAQVDFMFSTIAASGPLVKGGRVRGLAITSGARQALLPDVPTVGETVIPGYEVSEWNGIFLPAGTPDAAANTLHQALVAALAEPELQKRFTDMGAQIIGSTPAEFTGFLARQNAQWAEVVRTGNIRLD